MYTTLIKVEDLYQHFQKTNWAIIDCSSSLADREAGRTNYLEAHIPGALYAHLDEDLSAPVVPGKTGRHPLPAIEDVVALFSSWGIDENTQVVVYDDKSGAIAARLWWMLRWMGHQNVAVLDGGWQKWKQADYPTASGMEHRVPSIFIPKADHNLALTVEEVSNRSLTTTLIDARTSERYQGEMEPIDPIAGHIPGALNYPHPENIGADGLWLSPNDIRIKIEQVLGDMPKHDVVFYCGSGVTACRNILAFEYAGLGKARLYSGSWSGWIADGSRPIE